MHGRHAYDEGGRKGESKGKRRVGSSDGEKRGDT